MFRKAVSSLIVMMLLASVLVLAFNVKDVKGEWAGTVYIRADGSIDPPDAPIMTYDNITYTLTDNITSTADGIVVERNNIVVDGAGFTVQGTRASGSKGVDLSEGTNVTIWNMRIENFEYGVYAYSSSNNTISSCSISKNFRGIYLREGSNNYIVSICNISLNDFGFYAAHSHNHVIKNNKIMQNHWGIVFDTSHRNILINNTMIKDGVIPVGLDAAKSIKVMDESNTVNGKPVYYWKNRNYGKVPEGAGLIFLVNCSNVEVSNQNVSATDLGIWLMLSSNIIITNTSASSNDFAGIWLCYSSNTTVSNNILQKNDWYGIYLWSASQNVISENNISLNNFFGIRLLFGSKGNLIYHNNFIDNSHNAESEEANIWEYGYPSGGNYWSDYTGVDRKCGPDQSLLGSDGIGDAPYVIDENDIDHYPLMKPWVPFEGQTIHIRADGSIDPTGAPILRRGDVYTLIGDITSYADGIIIERDNITIDGSGYTIQGSGHWTGIRLLRNNVTVRNVIIKGFNYGFRIDGSYNTVTESNITANYWSGILIYGSKSTISQNNIMMNYWYNVRFVGGSNNIFFRNNIARSDCGIHCDYGASNNTFYENNIVNNRYGIYLGISSNNKFFHNNFKENSAHIANVEYQNIWDDGYPSGGNYWSNYAGVDLYSGPYQNETGSDGIGDMPFVIDANNVDRYPLIEPWALTPILLKPDLSISSQDLSFSDSNPLEGEIITISATIHNRGNGSARNVLVHFFDGTTLLASKQISFISQGSYGIASIDWTAKDEGFHPIKVVVDPYNAIDEINEENNEATRSILVGKIPCTGGIILKGSVTPIETTVGSRVTIQGYAIYNTTYGYGAPVAGAEVTITITEWEQVKTHTINDGTYKAEITAPYTPGNYTIIVTITDFTFQESIELNLSVISIEGIDLTLSSRDITFSPSDPLENQVVNITAKIHNIGTENAYNVSVAFYDNGKPITSQTIDRILAEESKEITITWNATPWGWHTISVIIDPANEIAETNENNNEASQSIRVYPILPDLTPIDIRFSDDTPLVNQTITITAIVQNIGGIEASNVLVSFYHEDELIGNATILNIAGKDGTAMASLSYAFTTEGWHKICVFADSDNTITEADEENNIYCKSIYVHLPLPDLAISPSDITFSNNTPTIGDTITIYATVHNIGEVTAYNVTVEVHVDGSRIGYIMFDCIPEGGKETFSVEWTATPAGWRKIEVVIDSNNTILELNENNNEATMYIYVSPELAPDICIHSEDIIFSNINPDPGELITIFATVHNIGQADAYNVTVTFYVDDIQIGSPHTIPSIPAGGEETVSTTWIASQVGSHVVKIFADVPLETNKINNVATRAIIVGEVYFELTITSSPITGITFTINGTSQTTPYTESLVTGIYIIEVPETYNGYVWSHWLEDGDTNRTKIIILDQNATWTAVYTALPPLLVSISPSTAEIKVGESVTFTSSVSGGNPPYTYQWYLNGSSISEATEGTWTFAPLTAGTYQVYLVVTDSLGNTTKSNEATVTVAPPLIVSIFPMSASLQVGQSLTFNSTVSGGYPPYTYQWYLDDGPVPEATSEAWIFTPTEYGIYYVYLEVTDSKNNTIQSEAAKIEVQVPTVGGECYPIENPRNTIAQPTEPHILIILQLAVILTITIKKNKKRNYC